MQRIAYMSQGNRMDTLSHSKMLSAFWKKRQSSHRIIKIREHTDLGRHREGRRLQSLEPHRFSRAKAQCSVQCEVTLVMTTAHRTRLRPGNADSQVTYISEDLLHWVTRLTPPVTAL